MQLAEKINRYNAYVGSSTTENKLAGITSEVTLPTFKEKSEELDLAGMGGDIDSPSIGSFESTEVEIPFSNISEQMMRLVTDDSQSIILRSAQEELYSSNLSRSLIGRTITMKGMTKEINFGKLKKGGYGEPSVKKELVYYKEEYNGQTIIEVDKFNNVYVVNGEDKLAGLADLI